MERLWIREVRRAARRATAPFARLVTLGCAASAVGTMTASLLPLPLNGVAAQAAWAALLAVAGYVALWTGLFIYHLCRYRASGFRDHDWVARRDDSDPDGALFLELGPGSGAMPNPGVDLELCVKSHGNWEVVDDDEVVLMPNKVVRCRFDLNHEVFPGGFYDVRWFRPDDEASSLKSPGSGSNCGITPSAAGQDLYRGTIHDWLPKRCPSARTRSSPGGWLPMRWAAGTRSVHGER
jgi:hypothetical protein